MTGIVALNDTAPARTVKVEKAAPNLPDALFGGTLATPAPVSPARKALPTFSDPHCTVIETPAAHDEEDRVLVRQYLDGDRNAAGSLVDRYQRTVFNIALRMLGNVQDAEDVTQTVFGNAFDSISSYDPQYRFFSWIYRMTVNESLNQLKRRKPMVTLEDGSDIPSGQASTDSTVEAEDLVRLALMNLNPDDRAIVVLQYFRSLSYAEIAEVLGIPVITVKSRLFTARERMRLALSAQRA
jgi:RNA polymerase sigma-70 factor (ECF subfamily)